MEAEKLASFKTNNQVVILVKEEKNRKMLKSILESNCFQVEFTNEPQKVVQIINRVNASIFLHDWDSIDYDQNVSMHQRISKIDELPPLCTIVYAAKITPSMLALSVDTKIDRIITKTNLKINLVEEIKMTRSGVTEVDSLREKIREIHNKNDSYSQNEINELVVETFERYPHDPIVKLEFGNLCYRRNNFKRAENLSLELININRNNVRAMNLLSRIYMKQKNYDKSLAILKNANILSPKNLDRLILLGDICYEKGDTNEARSYYKEACAEYSDNKEAISSYAEFEIKENNFDVAIELFKKSMSEEEAAGLLNNAGVQAVRLGQYEDALKFYKLAYESLKTNKHIPQILFNLGLAYLRQKMHEEALRHFKMAAAEKPDFRKANAHVRNLEKYLNKQKSA